MQITIIVSIHTSVQDVTVSKTMEMEVLSCFNPHIRTGCDCIAVHNGWIIIDVSIHTSVQDVTSPANTDSPDGEEFQSTHPYRM